MVVQERPGHSWVGITLNTHSHVLPGLGREAVERLGAVLQEEAGRKRNRPERRRNGSRKPMGQVASTGSLRGNAGSEQSTKSVSDDAARQAISHPVQYARGTPADGRSNGRSVAPGVAAGGRCLGLFCCPAQGIAWWARLGSNQ